MDYLLQKINRLRSSSSFAAYQKVLPLVSRYLSNCLEPTSQASSYWSEEIAGFEYLFDASPLIIDKLKEHSYHLTGIHSYKYRDHHAYSQNWFYQKHLERFKLLSDLDPLNLFVPESSDLGGFGFDFGYGLTNVDTLKYYEVMIGLQKADFLPDVASNFSVLEVGAGWGGFSYGFKTLFPHTKYIIVDLPHTMLFSAINMVVSFPDASFLFYDDLDFDLRLLAGDYDFCFVPNYAFNSTLKLPFLDLAINIASFQEMSSTQVHNYLSTLSLSGCRNFYSLNRICSPYNNELDSVFDLLAQYYQIKQLSILPDSYLSVGKKSKKKPKQVDSPLTKKNVPSSSSKPSKMSKDYVHHCGVLLDNY